MRTSEDSNLKVITILKLKDKDSDHVKKNEATR